MEIANEEDCIFVCEIRSDNKTDYCEAQEFKLKNQTKNILNHRMRLKNHFIPHEVTGSEDGSLKFKKNSESLLKISNVRSVKTKNSLQKSSDLTILNELADSHYAVNKYRNVDINKESKKDLFSTKYSTVNDELLNDISYSDPTEETLDPSIPNSAIEEKQCFDKLTNAIYVEDIFSVSSDNEEFEMNKDSVYDNDQTDDIQEISKHTDEYKIADTYHEQRMLQSQQLVSAICIKDVFSLTADKYFEGDILLDNKEDMAVFPRFSGKNQSLTAEHNIHSDYLILTNNLSEMFADPNLNRSYMDLSRNELPAMYQNTIEKDPKLKMIPRVYLERLQNYGHEIKSSSIKFSVQQDNADYIHKQKSVLECQNCFADISKETSYRSCYLNHQSAASLSCKKTSLKTHFFPKTPKTKNAEDKYTSVNNRGLRYEERMKKKNSEAKNRDQN